MPEPSQPAPETEAKHSPGWGRYAIWAVGIVIFYVLSSGPAFKLYSTGILSDKALIIYRPLNRLYDFHPPFHKPLGMYWHLWWPERFASDGEFAL